MSFVDHLQAVPRCTRGGGLYLLWHAVRATHQAADLVQPALEKQAVHRLVGLLHRKHSQRLGLRVRMESTAGQWVVLELGSKADRQEQRRTRSVKGAPISPIPK